ncbi:MAG: ABC transporter permease [Dethiobacteria bacterium]|nr:ABC transporter permease [Bacillota bacterium]
MELANSKSNSRGKSIRNFLGEYYTWIMFIVLYIVAGIIVPNLFTSTTMVTILVQGTTVCLLAFGMTFAMLVGEIDMSIVAVAAFSPMISIMLWEAGLPVPLAMILVLLFGVVVGIFNGLMVTKMKIPSLIQTVAVWWMLSGFVLIVTKGAAKTGLPDAWMFMGRFNVIGRIPLLIPFFVLVLILAIIFARRTVTGRRMYLVGGNADACAAMGIPVDRIKIIAFVMSGVFAALAGYVLSARMGFVSARFAVEWLMPAIAAPVIAGVSMNGGKGNLINVIAGAYLVQLIVMIVRTGGVGGYYTDFVQGVIVFIAILINTFRERLSQ